MNEGSHGTGPSATDGGRVLFEETLSIGDQGGAATMIKFVRIAVVFMILMTLVSIVLVFVVGANMFVSAAGGMDVALSILRKWWAERPLPMMAFGLAVLGGLVFGLLLIVGFVLNLRRAFDEQVTVRVTDAGLGVQREGGRWYQPSGIEVLFDVITAVEYVDPDESSFRIEFRDWRAPKFFAGRSQNWIRIERRGEPAVYVGSDRPRKLAETIARRVPGDVTAEPY